MPLFIGIVLVIYIFVTLIMKDIHLVFQKNVNVNYVHFHAINAKIERRTINYENQ